ncbi:MAG: anti-sigma factor antagonist [Chlamydiae bacterium]|nr:anti-sigma factor antagonist [Chlamydiota bacterium]
MVLTIREEIKSPWTILYLSGKLDVLTAEFLEESLSKCFHEGKSDVAINFCSLSYLSSSGIRVLLLWHKKFYEQNRQILLIELPFHIAEIISLAGFDKVFKIAKDFNEVKNSL